MTTAVAVATAQRTQMVDITSRVQQVVTETGIRSGFAVCFVPHTTAAVTINENSDPDVTGDILSKLDREIPRFDGYHHVEGNSDAHVKATLVGASQQILIEEGRLLLGRWQAIYFCEFDGPRQRQVHISVFGRAQD